MDVKLAAFAEALDSFSYLVSLDMTELSNRCLESTHADVR
jgi:hypothetical protein